jgi:virginiamycin B lyase
LWFADAGNNAIGRMSRSGQLTEFPALAPDGGMWFTESSANKIGRIDTSGKIYEFNVPTPNAHPAGIAAPPTPSSCNPSQVWFTEANSNKIASITY